MPTQKADEADSPRQGISRPPSVSVPKGGAAIRGIGEKFAANPVTGTGSTSVPLAISPGRSDFGPQLSLAYDSGSGNGPFGFGWNLSIPSITRKTDKGLPRYEDAVDSDVFVLSGTEDLQPLLVPSGAGWARENPVKRVLDGVDFLVERYRPRIEGLFARIERWTEANSGQSHWRSISRENITTLYGRNEGSRIADPSDPKRIFSWLICESHDDKGNVIVYEYQREDSAGIETSALHEKNRTPASRSSNLYLKFIRYGNRVSRLVQPSPADPQWMFVVVFDYDDGHYEKLPPDPLLGPDRQHEYIRAAEAPGRSWPVRPDPFSSYRSGFEVRTYRRCHRVLMFHRFPELGAQPCLVRSMEFDYGDLDYAQPGPAIDVELSHPGSTRFASFIGSITQSGFVRDGAKPVVTIDGVDYVTYLRKSLPPLEFEYSRGTIQEDVRELDDASLENLPAGLDSARQWIDLDGEGVSGILSEVEGCWYYKANLGEGRFGPLQPVTRKPSLAALGRGRQQLLDLAGDGQLDLVDFDQPTPGFYERSLDADWETLKPFAHLPRLRWDDPNLRLVDLNGDGHADILITEDQAFTWYPSLAEAGFGPALRVDQPLDEEKGPRLVFADGAQSIYLADMSGDGLTDLVRIRNGEVCYWPSLGYGRFGAKVNMENAPWFDHVDHFTHRRLRLADIDGSGTNDIIYLGRDTARVYFNRSGNSLGAARPLQQFPRLDDLSSATPVDLLGNGTACLVWSSEAPAESHHPLRYIDLMGGKKPHLLIRSANNLGAETRIHYVSSTKFYLADKAAGKPWITKLPFPVHVVDRLETYDYISRNRFVTRYAYHHGHFDGEEREFRGFGLVEQWDTEEMGALTASGGFPVGDNIEEASAIPPVYTKTWFHTGAYLGRKHISDYFAGLLDGEDLGEYYREPGLSDNDARKLLLDDTRLPAGLSVEEEREACRALKGATLRQEVYGLDGSVRQAHPYTVSEQNLTVELVQPKGPNRHAVFFTHPRETLHYQYERNPDDPRVAHSLTLEVDSFGNILKVATIGYGRRKPDLALAVEDRDRQALILITYTENRFTNPIDTSDQFRAPQPAETRTFELTGMPAPVGGRYSLSDLLSAGAGAATIAYHTAPDPDVLQKRLIEHVRTYYRRDDLSGPLTLGDLESLALPFESFQLAMTPAQVTAVFGARVTDAMLSVDGGYVHTEGDGNWWTPSGRVYFSPDINHTPAEELAFARQHFFLPFRFRDPFHSNLVNTETVASYDVHDLLLVETLDPLGNRTTAGARDDAGNLVLVGNDYRVLQASLVMDANRNRAQVAFDALGMVVGMAVMGKPLPAPVEGDSLAAFTPDLTDFVLQDHLSNPLVDPFAILGSASSRLVHDLHAYRRSKGAPHPQPSVTYTLTRETHDSDPVPIGGMKVQHNFAYSDGFGRVIQKKIGAEPGPVPQRAADGTIVVGADGQPVMTANAVSPRWVGTGWTVFNNKGKAVRQYEPFFTDTHTFEFDLRLGVSPTVFYDPQERVVATLRPDHTWEKALFDAWRREGWDASDTALIVDPKTDLDVGDFFARLPVTEYLPTWHAQRQGGGLGSEEQAAAAKTAIHAATPSVAYDDPLGRTFLSIAHNRFKYSDAPPNAPPLEEFQATRTVFDIEGNPRQLIDAKGRVTMRSDYDMLGIDIHQASMEAGERWNLKDVFGKAVYGWDSRNHRFHSAYDALRRKTDSTVQGGAGPEILASRVVYGETQPNPETNNLRGRVFRTFDQAGVVTTGSYDFKGNLLSASRRLAQAYKISLDWSAPVPMEVETYTSRTRFDALSRPVQLTSPRSDQIGSRVNVVQPVYNQANLMERIDAWTNQNAEPADLLPPASANLNVVTNIDYDAKGRRERVDYGNGVSSTYRHDPLTFRLRSLSTVRGAPFGNDCPQPAPPGWPGCQAQNLTYTYDAVGNIVHVGDQAQQTIYFRNRRVEPSADYRYDAVYRLIEAVGREHLGQVAAPPPPSSYNDWPRIGVPSPADGQAAGLYLERYFYDPAGNFQQVKHIGTDPVDNGWTRSFVYDEPSQIDPVTRSNRLTRATIGAATTEIYSVGGDGYDPHGNMLRMDHLASIEWDFLDQLRMTERQAVNAQDGEGLAKQGERTWYVYDLKGQRVRKVTERAGGGVKEQRVYLGGFEIYAAYGVNSLVRETLHIMDDQQRIAMVETRTDLAVPQVLVRYQFGNHLGSASLELDEQGDVISYEEYTPYGSTSFQAVRSQAEAAKRFRFAAKERDEESGFYYHGARYYATWMGRWISCDPQWGSNLYLYVRANPIQLFDPDGAEESSFASRLWGGVRLIGGAAQVVAGAAVFVQIEVPVAAQVVGGVAVVHGASDIEAGWRQIISGKQERSVVEQGVTAAAKGLGATKPTAEAIGTGVDIGLGFVSPAPISGGPRAAVAISQSRAAVLSIEAARAAEATRLAQLAKPVQIGTHVMMAATAPGTQGKSGGATSDPPADPKPAPTATPTPPKPPPPLPPVRKIPPGVGKEPTRIKPSEITAKPKGGARSAWDEAALANKGVTPRGVFPRSPLHHTIPQEVLKNPAVKALLKKRNIDIDNFAVRISEGEHSAIHTMDYNQKWLDFFKNNMNATRAEILDFLNKMRKAYKIDKLPLERYVK